MGTIWDYFNNIEETEEAQKHYDKVADAILSIWMMWHWPYVPESGMVVCEDDGFILFS